MQGYARISKNTLEYTQYAQIRSICSNMLKYAQVSKNLQEYTRICNNTQEQARISKNTLNTLNTLQYARVSKKMQEYAPPDCLSTWPSNCLSTWPSDHLTAWPPNRLTTRLSDVCSLYMYARCVQSVQECAVWPPQFACCDSCTQLKKSLGRLQVANKCTQLQTVGVVGVEVGLNLKYN